VSDCISFHDKNPLDPTDTTRVRVNLPFITVTSTFGQVVGQKEYKATADAEAEVVLGVPYAIFGIGLVGGCNETVEISDDTTVNGTVHSNSTVEILSNVTVNPEVTHFGAYTSQSPSVVHRLVSSTQGDPLASTVDVRDYRPGAPKALAAGNDYVDLSGVDPVRNQDLIAARALAGGVFADKLVYTRGNVVLDGPLSGKVTIVQERPSRTSNNQIHLQGGAFNLEHWSGDSVLFLAAGSRNGGGCHDGDAIELNLDSQTNHHFKGLIYAPNGGVEVDDQGGSPRGKTFDGSIVADEVDLDGDNDTLNRQFLTAAPPSYRLFL
jgi:hypothetical protein